MNEKVSCYTKIQNRKIRKKLYNLNKYLLKQNEKVSYAYKNLVTGDFFTFNYDICFYAASSIKFLVALYIYQKAEKDDKILDEKIILKEEDFKLGSGVLKNNKEKLEYTIRELIYFCLKESDNTAYIKLVLYITKEKLIEFGKSLGALHTLEGVDLFGIVNSFDMMIYLEALYKYFNLNTILSKELKEYMINPGYEIITPKNLNNKEFVKKYGSFGIAYHEVRIVYDDIPYILIVLTQKDKLKEYVKKKYVNCVARKIANIHRYICKAMKK